MKKEEFFGDGLTPDSKPTFATLKIPVKSKINGEEEIRKQIKMCKRNQEDDYYKAGYCPFDIVGGWCKNCTAPEVLEWVLKVLGK